MCGRRQKRNVLTILATTATVNIPCAGTLMVVCFVGNIFAVEMNLVILLWIRRRRIPWK